MATTTKTFLDYTGLEKLWEKISNGFSPRWYAYRPSDSAAVGTNTTEVILRYQSAGTANDGALGGERIVQIPAATATSAGVMSANDKKTLDSIGIDINNAINLQNIAIESNILKTGTVGGKEKTINIGFDYNTQKLRLLDKNDSNKVLASVDLTDIIKDRFLAAAEVVNTKDGDTAPTGLYLKLTFIVKDLANNNDVTESIYIDVNDLIDIYNAGEGIDINQGAENTADNTKRSSTISLKAAATDALGGIKVHRSHSDSSIWKAVTPTRIPKRFFGVDLGYEGKAIVNVPIGSLEAGNNVISGTVTLNPAKGGTVDVITGVNSIANNSDKTGNIIALGGTTISLAAETSVTTPATTANAGKTLKFGETFTPLMTISAGGTNGHQISSTNTTFTLPTPSIEFTSISYNPSSSNPITATNDGSCIIVNQIDGFKGGVSNTGTITIEPIYSSKKYWVDVESIADTVIDGLQYPAY